MTSDGVVVWLGVVAAAEAVAVVPSCYSPSWTVLEGWPPTRTLSLHCLLQTSHNKHMLYNYLKTMPELKTSI